MKNDTVREIKKEFEKYSNPEKAKTQQKYFKTGKGEYGEGDIFLGITVPDTRKIAQKYKNISLYTVKKFLHSPFHEERLFALLVLIYHFQSGEEEDKNKIYEFYLENTKFINNWDLVDLSVRDIIGAYLYNRDKTPLYELAKSNNLWERRIAIIATYYFIRQNEFEDTINIAEILLNDREDLIHKAVGWMLREVGKKDLAVEEIFLKRHYKGIPRTMVRYAVERFPEEKRKRYLLK